MTGFKDKTIKLVLRRKLKAWIASIADPALRKIIENDAMICGGAIVSLLQGEKPNDYDIYFKTKETTIAVAKHYVNEWNFLNPVTINKDIIAYAPEVKEEQRINLNSITEDRVLIHMKSAGVAGENQEPYQYFELRPAGATESFMASLEEDPFGMINKVMEEGRKKDWRPVFLTDNAITLSNKIQIIIRFNGTFEEIIENYDFDHCKCSYDYKTDTINIPKEVYRSVLSKTLVYTGSLYPLTSMFRIRKFMKRGWSISAGQMLKIAYQIKLIDFTSEAVLKEQLMGVDSAYMSQFLEAIKQQDDTTKIDSAYIVALIDKVFED